VLSAYQEAEKIMNGRHKRWTGRVLDSIVPAYSEVEKGPTGEVIKPHEHRMNIT